MQALLAAAFDQRRLPPLLRTRRVALAQLQPHPAIVGSGSFGVVHKAAWSSEGAPPQPVALKLMHRHRIVQRQLQLFERALELELSLAPHPNICRLYCWACSAEEERLLVVLEYCPGGSLAGALETGETAAWPLPRRLCIARALTCAIAFLHGHEPPVVHRDIKPDNLVRMSDH